MAHNVVATGFSMYNPRRLERMAYGSFQGAGIDLFTDPVAQEPDKFHDLTNVMPAINGGFNRRWGFNEVPSYLMPFTTTTVKRMFSYTASADTSFTGTADTRIILGTDNTSVLPLLNEVGSAAFNLPTFPSGKDIWGITSRAWFYACNGKDTPRKIDYSQHTTDTNSRWGIPTPGGSLTTIGGGGGGTVIVTDGPYMDIDPGLTTGFTTYYADGVVGSGFTSAPTVTFSPTGATATATLYHDGIVDISVTAGGSYTSAPTVTISGGGGTVSSSSFEAVLNGNGEVSAVIMKGNITLAAGRQYAIALKNSVTGHTSNFIATKTGLRYLKEPSGTITTSTDDAGAILNQGCDTIIVPFRIPVDSVDAQVDTVVLMATADGGDLGHLYEVAQLPLSSFTVAAGDYTYVYKDSLPDTVSDTVITGGTLLTRNLWVDTSATGQIIGINDNTPPGNWIAKPVINQGRMFATDGKSIYFSKSIDEVTTSTGLITSKWEEAWPGANVLDIAYDDEDIVALKSDGEIVYTGTTDNIFRLLGNSASNFSIPATIFRGVGVKSQDTWEVIYKDNIPAGYVWVTSDDKIMFSDFNTYNEIGKPIYPLLKSLGDVTHIQSLSYGPYSFAILAIANDSKFTYLLYDTKVGGWYLWNKPNENPTATGYFTPLLSYTDVNGVQRLYAVCQTGSGVSLRNDLRYFNDQHTYDDEAGTDFIRSIGWSVETSWLCLKDTASDNVLNELEIWSDDSNIAMDVYRALVSADFGSPILVKSGAPITTPFGSKLPLAGAKSFGRFHKVRFSAPSATYTYSGQTWPSAVLRQFQLEFFPHTRS